MHSRESVCYGCADVLAVLFLLLMVIPLDPLCGPDSLPLDAVNVVDGMEQRLFLHGVLDVCVK